MNREIRTCFGLYNNYIKTIVKPIDEYTSAEIDDMSIDDIRTFANVLHMKYILSSYSISETSTAMIAYKHLTSLIDKNTLLNKMDIIDNDYLLTKDKVGRLELVLDKINGVRDVENNDDKRKRWIF